MDVTILSMVEQKSLLPEDAIAMLQEQPRYTDHLNKLLGIYIPLLQELPSLREKSAMMAEVVKAKSPTGITDVATGADIYAQAQIKLGVIRLGWQFWGEEGEDSQSTLLDEKYPFTVILDPIEGTNNFRWRIDKHWG